MNNAEVLQKEKFKNSAILIVDDDQINLLILKEILSSDGFTDIMLALSAKEALIILERRPVDLVIIDIVMPEMDGLELCKKIRAKEATANIPIIVQTAKNGMHAKAFEAGATDFIEKPIKKEELTVRAKVHLQNTKLVNELRVYRRQMTQELRQAQMMQQLLLPSKKNLTDIAEEKKFNLLCHHHALLILGGDFWGCWSPSEHELCLYIVDISGHGISAALNAFRLHTLIDEGKVMYSQEPGMFLGYLNKRLHTFFAKGQFATMFYAVIDKQQKVIRYAVAASTEPFIYRSATKTVEALEQKGYPLGVIEEAQFSTHQTDFKPNDALLLYSDALVETESKSGKMLDGDEIKKIFSAGMDASDGTITSFFNRFVKYYYDHFAEKLFDDLSIVVCHYDDK